MYKLRIKYYITFPGKDRMMYIKTVFTIADSQQQAIKKVTDKLMSKPPHVQVIEDVDIFEIDRLEFTDLSTSLPCYI